MSHAVERMRLSLMGLRVGDCFGECFMVPPGIAMAMIESQDLSAGPWPYTDDTEMALSIVEQLEARGDIEQNELAELFARRLSLDRGYGKGAFKILMGVQQGVGWRGLSYSAFGGMGSFGNGAAMRVAPLGAYFAGESMEKVIEQSRLSAEVTHTHPEGIAGAVAVAVATALAWERREDNEVLGMSWVEDVMRLVPEGYTKEAIAEVFEVPAGTHPREVAGILGNGAGVTAPDTIPICLWMAAHYSRDFVSAMWQTVGALGDRDTTCAIVGGIIAMTCGVGGIPEDWLAAAEEPAS